MPTHPVPARTGGASRSRDRPGTVGRIGEGTSEAASRRLEARSGRDVTTQHVMTQHVTNKLVANRGAASLIGSGGFGCARAGGHVYESTEGV